MAARTSEERASSSRPMSVELIVKNAQNYDYNPLIPLKYWLRTAGTLLKEAEIYEHEGNDQQTYLLLFRHAQLVLKNLSAHPDARQVDNRRQLVLAENEVERSLAKLEVLKPRINRRYERYQQLIRDREARKAGSSERGGSPAQDAGGRRRDSPHIRYTSDPAVAGSREALAAGENRDLAVKLAHKEIRRRATARKATRQAGISEEEEQERRAAGVWGNWEEDFTKDDRGIDQDTLSRQMQDVRLQLNGAGSNGNRSGTPRPTSAGRGLNYHYPLIPEKSAQGNWKPPIISPSLSKDGIFPSIEQVRLPPEPPPKDGMLVGKEYPPARPEKYNSPSERPPSRSSTATPPQQDLAPSTFTFKPSAYLENGSPLRTIFLPPDLRHRFLSVALPNTRSNLETCGILCGTLISNALFISKLVIPDQESTSDTCETVNESELFDYVDGEDLMVLGWIHTHPTQTCFMSSRDLHTHCGYQVMMPESIAIVCAPSKGEWGVFRMTDPPGMKTVLGCTQTGLFHPHAENNIYTDALRPGHVVEAKGLEFNIVDLRPDH